MLAGHVSTPFRPSLGGRFSFFPSRFVHTVVLVLRAHRILPTEPCVLRTFGCDGKFNTCAESVSQRNSGTDCTQIKVSEKSTPPNVRNTHSSVPNVYKQTRSFSVEALRSIFETALSTGIRIALLDRVHDYCIAPQPPR